MLSKMTKFKSGKIISFEYSSDNLFILFFGDMFISIYDESNNKVLVFYKFYAYLWYLALFVIDKAL